MALLDAEVVTRAKELIALYPERRSALVPLCHLAQASHGWLDPELIEQIAGLLELTPAEVLGTASFYEMLRTEPTGKYLVSICTNIACMLAGAYELLEHAEEVLGTKAGSSSADGTFTLEEIECIADCDRAPCAQVNYRFFGNLTNDAFDQLVDDLRANRLSRDVPDHGVLCRVRRNVGLEVPADQIAAERAAADRAAAERAAARETRQEGAS